MEIVDRIQSFSQREKYLLILLGIVIFGTIVYLISLVLPAKPVVAQNQVVSPHQPAIQERPRQPVVMQSNVTISGTKNPFLIPSQYQVPKEPKANSPSSPTASVPAAVPKPMPVLRGIVSRGPLKMAILEFAGNNDTVRIGDDCGPYNVKSIAENQVVLAGPEGQLVLTLGR